MVQLVVDAQLFFFCADKVGEVVGNDQLGQVISIPLGQLAYKLILQKLCLSFT